MKSHNEHDHDLRSHPNFYRLIELIIDEVYHQKDTLTQNLRIKYRLENNNEEKNLVTTREIKKIKETISNYKGLVIDYVFDCLKDGEIFCDDYQILSMYIHNIGYERLSIKKLDSLNLDNVDSFTDIDIDQNTFLLPFKEFTEIIPLIGVYHDLKLIKNSLEEDKSKLFENTEVKWYSNQTEFIELIKALIENKSLRGKQKDIITNLSRIFGIKINNPNKLIQDIKNRNRGSETLFIDKLKTTLFDYITKENIR